ncbi:MAG TPA: flagellar hook-basal body complex protein FliE [Tepidisphaeraceae bacterium]|jgi:flagellar hook-basal body complex protein FliE
MINGVTNNLSLRDLSGAGAASEKPSAGAAGTSSTQFADVLKNSINDVAKLQQDASQAVEDLATGRSEDVTGVMMAMEKSDLAFKTLLAIRAKLMDAYEEIKGMQI